MVQPAHDELGVGFGGAEGAEVIKAIKEALFTAGVDAIAGVVKALGSAPPPYNFILAGITAAAAALQIAQISSKPLPKYAKGHKAGYADGEMAWVGERGPEIMWVPNGAGIVPAHKSKSLTPDVMREFNIPIPPLPQMPYIPERVLHEFRASSQGAAAPGVEIDYERLGGVIAAKIPPQTSTSVNVNMDEGGFKKYLVSDVGRTSILNKRHSIKS